MCCSFVDGVIAPPAARFQVCTRQVISLKEAPSTRYKGVSSQKISELLQGQTPLQEVDFFFCFVPVRLNREK